MGKSQYEHENVWRKVVDLLLKKYVREIIMVLQCWQTPLEGDRVLVKTCDWPLPRESGSCRVWIGGLDQDQIRKKNRLNQLKLTQGQE